MFYSSTGASSRVSNISGGLSVGNLIDLSSPPPTGPTTAPLREHNYVNDTSLLSGQGAPQPSQDVFGMRKYKYTKGDPKKRN